MNPTDLIYLDNAATSWPKPPEVAQAMLHSMQQVGANPGRSGHRLSIEAARIVYEAREAVAALFHAPDPLRVVFTANVTQALNLALHGWLRPGDHVVTSGMEHNAVMRPLRALEANGVQVSVVPCSAQGLLDPADVQAALRPNTALVVLNHASNVCGTLLPVGEVGQIARRRGIPFVVDAAQTGGAFPLDMQALGIDMLAFTGHKSMLGPMGTGGLVLGPGVDVERLAPQWQGGTGSRSESEKQPIALPDKYESGTSNAVGIAGLGAAVRWVMAQGVDTIRAHEVALCQQMLDGLLAISGVQVYGPHDAARQTATVSFNIIGMTPSDVGLRLDDEYGVLCRVGLHCAPAAHRTLGTFPGGVVRFGLGVFNTSEQVAAAVAAVSALAREVRP